MNWNQQKIAVIGLGYVGLPLAVEFGKTRRVVGFDINAKRIAELRDGRDSTLEVTSEELDGVEALEFTSNRDDLRECGIFIVTVPTPIDQAKRPDLRPLCDASALVGDVMPEGALVIFESTVYPGCTEEVCVPILAEKSGKMFNRGFFVGYSPERINPGDKEHRFTTITKVTSGSTETISQVVDDLYGSVVTAGTHRARSIKVAEAAKVIENTQRDLNIALMNELAIIFDRLGIDTLDVLEAAGSKWNFMPFRPGLVGGHCIGVDPYYLTFKAQEIGYHPEVILSGRRINDSMGAVVAERVVKLMLARNMPVSGGKVLVLGLAFKDNCPDLRNTRVVDIIAALRDYSVQVDVYDPWIDRNAAKHEYDLDCLHALPQSADYSAIVIAVAHHQFRAVGIDAIRALGRSDAVVFDVKSVLPQAATDGRL